MISNELMEGLTRINNVILTGELTHPGRFALLLEELAGDAWNEARRLGQATWDDAEDLQSSTRIDP
jgi:hypothetical protein